MASEINIIHGDCKEGMKNTPSKYYDLAIVDPPYFSGPEKRKYYGCEINKLNIKRIDYPVTEAWEIPDQEYFDELYRVSKHQIIWGCNYYDTIYPGTGRIVWDKVNDSSSFSDCEIAFCSLISSVRIFRFMWNGMMQGKNISQGHLMQGDKSKNERRIHPTQKPVALYKWTLQKFSKPGMKILDTHFGSGSSGIACYDFGCNLDAYEKTMIHYNNAVNRFETHKKQLTIF